MKAEYPAWVGKYEQVIVGMEQLQAEVEVVIAGNGNQSCEALALMCEQHRSIVRQLKQMRLYLAEHKMPYRFTFEPGELCSLK